MTRRVLRLKAVKEATGLSRSPIYVLRKRGLFPASVRIGPKAVGWFEDEVLGYVKSRPRVGGDATTKETVNGGGVAPGVFVRSFEVRAGATPAQVAGLASGHTPGTHRGVVGRRLRSPSAMTATSPARNSDHASSSARRLSRNVDREYPAAKPARRPCPSAPARSSSAPARVPPGGASSAQHAIKPSAWYGAAAVWRSALSACASSPATSTKASVLVARTERHAGLVDGRAVLVLPQRL